MKRKHEKEEVIDNEKINKKVQKDNLDPPVKEKTGSTCCSSKSTCTSGTTADTAAAAATTNTVKEKTASSCCSSKSSCTNGATADSATTTDANANAAATPSTDSKDPAYGTQEYWENRYKKNQSKAKVDADNNDKENGNENGGDEGEDEDMSPGHEWYFSYQELRGLILPLLLGGRGDDWSDDDDSDDDSDDGGCCQMNINENGEEEITCQKESKDKEEEEKDNDGSCKKANKSAINLNDEKKSKCQKESKVEKEEDSKMDCDDNGGCCKKEDDSNTNQNGERKSKCQKESKEQVDEKGATPANNSSSSGGTCNKAQQEDAATTNNGGGCCSGGVCSKEVEEEEEDEYDEETCKLYTEAATNANTKDTITSPKKVLEIGCGDVPLGKDLCSDLLQFQSLTEVKANLVVDEIVCFDYSPCVIDLLVKGQKEEEKENNLTVKYDVLDARKLPFEANKFNLIIDKGTLDAMLSDKDEGTKNCIQIVSEASRTLACGGYLVIVSHLNASDAAGLSWVDQVLITGLRNGDTLSDWRIEVHSNADDCEDVDGGDRDSGDDEAKVPGDEEKENGPAVYIIQKVVEPDDIAEKREADENNTSKVDIKFFGY